VGSSLPEQDTYNKIYITVYEWRLTKMALYKYLRELWKKPTVNMSESYRKFLITIRKQGSSEKIEKPTRLDRARSLGYKAKKGFILVRERIPKGASKRNKRHLGVKHSSMRRLKVVAQSNQVIAERRANKRYPNLEVLNSYWVAEDGHYIWYEVIMVDPFAPTIINDPKLNHLLLHRGRVNRGLTSAAKKSRGLLHKGKGTEKLRPSKHASRKRKLGVQKRKGREYVAVMQRMKKLK